MVNFANSATGDSLEVGFLFGQHGNTAFPDCFRSIVSVAGCKGQTSGNTGHYRNEIAVVLCIVFAVGGCVWIPDGKADCHFGDAGQCNNWKLFCYGKEYGTPWNIDSLFRHDDNLVQCIHSKSRIRIKQNRQPYEIGTTADSVIKIERGEANCE